MENEGIIITEEYTDEIEKSIEEAFGEDEGIGEDKKEEE